MAKVYSSAAAAVALGISEASIEEKFEGAIKRGVDLSQILQLEDNAKLKRYHEEAENIRRILKGVKELEK